VRAILRFFDRELELPAKEFPPFVRILVNTGEFYKADPRNGSFLSGLVPKVYFAVFELQSSDMDFGFYVYKSMEFASVPFDMSNPAFYLQQAEDYFKTYYGIEMQ
jgi:hypothetical protein